MDSKTLEIAKLYIGLKQLENQLNIMLNEHEELEKDIMKLVGDQEIKFRYKGIKFIIKSIFSGGRTTVDYDGMYKEIYKINQELANEIFVENIKMKQSATNAIENAALDGEISDEIILKYTNTTIGKRKLKVKEFAND